jgi:hypothetical protein
MCPSGPALIIARIRPAAGATEWMLRARPPRAVGCAVRVGYAGEGLHGVGHHVEDVGRVPRQPQQASVSCLVVSWPIRSTRSSAVIRCAAGAAWVRLSSMVDSSTVMDGIDLGPSWCSSTAAARLAVESEARVTLSRLLAHDCDYDGRAGVHQDSLTNKDRNHHPERSRDFVPMAGSFRETWLTEPVAIPR